MLSYYSGDNAKGGQSNASQDERYLKHIKHIRSESEKWEYNMKKDFHRQLCASSPIYRY